MEARQINERYQTIAQKLINERKELEYIKHSNVQIICLSSDRAKKSGTGFVYGECEKVSPRYRWGIPYDFTITIFEPNVEGLSLEQIEILMFHELLHIGINGECYSVRKHDLEDFRTIIELYGTDWADKKDR